MGHMHQTEGLTELSAEHARWLQGLDFYRDEVGRLEERLKAFASGGMSSGSAGEVEHFQNQFIIQRNTIDELRHSIGGHVSRFGHAVSQGGHRSVSRMDEGHGPLREGYESFERVMNGLRQEFDRFIAGMR